MTANKPMTGEQLDELMTVAVNFQRDSEKAGERSCANFAYAVQVAVLELRKVRADVVALAAESAYLRGEIVQHSNSTHFCEKCGEADPCSNDDVCWSLKHPIPATDAFLAEVRAQGVDGVKQKISDAISKCYQDEMVGLDAAVSIAKAFAAQLRKGAAQ